MMVSVEDFRRQYADLSDEALLDVDRQDLVEMARACCDEELARRRLKSAASAPAAAQVRSKGVCRECGKAIVYWLSYLDERKGLCSACNTLLHRRMAAKKAQEESIQQKANRQAVLDAVANAFPDRACNEVVGVTWTQDYGLVGNLICSSVIPAALSGALGMSGPWLLALPSSAGSAFGVIVRFGDRIVFNRGDQIEVQDVNDILLKFKAKDPSALTLGGFSLVGTVSVAEHLGPENHADAESLVRWLQDRHLQGSRVFCCQGCLHAARILKSQNICPKCGRAID